MNDNFENNLLNNLMSTWVVPWVEKQQELDLLERPVTLTMAQIIFKPTGGPPEVRINEKVKGLMKVKVSDRSDNPVAVGDPVTVDQFDHIESFEQEDSDRDFAHATLIHLRDRWFISFNFVYNKNLSALHLSAAKEFLHAAKAALDSGYLRACIDNLYSAIELSSKAYLLGHPDKSILDGKSHGLIHSKINMERRCGNIQDTHVETFNQLRQMRNSARYLAGSLSVTPEDGNRMLDLVKDFIEDVSKRSQPKL